MTVSAAEDGDASQDTATVTHTVSGGDYGSVTADDVSVTVTDDDTPGVTVTPASLTVGEGVTGRYTVRLNTQPSGGNVTVAISSDNTDVTVSPISLTFTATNWSSAQTVTVSAAEDDDAANDTATLTHAPSGADYDFVSNADLAVTVTDDDTRGVTFTPTSLPVNEGGTNTYTVVLDTEPTAAVTVTIVDPTDNADVTASPASLTFFTSDWATAQTVTVSADEDADSTDETATVTHTVAGGDYELFAASSVAVTVTDDDTPGVTVTPLSLTVGEGGTDTYTVVLNTQPSGDVTVAISSNNTDVSASPSPLTFTTTTWSAEQTVTVSAGQDADAANDTATLTHDPSGADYGSVSNAILTVTVTDDDTRGVTVTPASLPVDEGGTGTYTVELNTQPTAAVRVTIVDPTDNADVTANPASLTFTTSNWSTAQTVTVSAAEDGDASQDTATVTHTVSGGDYGSVTADDVSVTVTDDDTPGVTVTPASLTVGEGVTGRYTVRLNTQPSGGNVTVAISSDNTDVTVSSPIEPDVHGDQLELGADGDGFRGRGRRCSERHGDLDARPERRRLRFCEQRRPGGDGHGRRHAGGDVHAHVAAGQRGRHEHVHRRAGHRTHGRRDGHHRRSDRQRGRFGESREPDVLDLELGLRRRRSRFRRPRTTTPRRTRPP